MAERALGLEWSYGWLLVSAAASGDFGTWSRVVGDRFAELALADMTTEEAVALRGSCKRRYKWNRDSGDMWAGRGCAVGVSEVCFGWRRQWR